MNISDDPSQPVLSSASSSSAHIRCAPGVYLSPDQMELLAQAFGSNMIFVKREFRSGYSGALVLLVSPGSDRAPVVLKLTHPLDLQREYEAYQRFVRPISPQNIAHLQGEPLLTADQRLGLLQYSFAGGDSQQAATSLEDYYETNGGSEAIFSPAIAQRMAHFFAGIRPPEPRRLFPELTEREREVLMLLTHNYSNAGIARELVISPKTVRNHVSTILSKLQATDRGEAAQQARDAGLG